MKFVVFTLVLLLLSMTWADFIGIALPSSQSLAPGFSSRANFEPHVIPTSLLVSSLGNSSIQAVQMIGPVVDAQRNMIYFAATSESWFSAQLFIQALDFETGKSYETANLELPSGESMFQLLFDSKSNALWVIKSLDIDRSHFAIAPVQFIKSRYNAGSVGANKCTFSVGAFTLFVGHDEGSKTIFMAMQRRTGNVTETRLVAIDSENCAQRATVTLAGITNAIAYVHDALRNDIYVINSEQFPYGTNNSMVSRPILYKVDKQYGNVTSPKMMCNTTACFTNIQRIAMDYHAMKLIFHNSTALFTYDMNSGTILQVNTFKKWTYFGMLPNFDSTKTKITFGAAPSTQVAIFLLLMCFLFHLL